MGTYDQRVAGPLERVTGPLIGQDFLPVLKEEMMKDPIMGALFKKGDRFFVTELPAVNDTVVPMLAMVWQGEKWQSQNTLVTGVIGGRIVLPADLKGKTDRFRGIVAAMMRWMNSNHSVFTRIPWCRQFAVNADFNYAAAITSQGADFPVIIFSFPVVFDIHMFKTAHPEVDFDAALDADMLGWVESYAFQIANEDGTVLLQPTPSIPTGQTN